MNNEAYKKGYELAFGNPPVEKGHWIYDTEKGKFVRPEEYSPPDSRKTAAILRQIDEFVSPIDGSVITDRAQLRRHNKQHGVSNLSDFGENNGKEYFSRKQKERDATIHGTTRAAKQERVELIKQQLHQHGY